MLACHTAMLHVASLTYTNQLPGVPCLYFGMCVRPEIPKLCAQLGVVPGWFATLATPTFRYFSILDCRYILQYTALLRDHETTWIKDPSRARGTILRASGLATLAVRLPQTPPRDSPSMRTATRITLQSRAYSADSSHSLTLQPQPRPRTSYTDKPSKPSFPFVELQRLDACEHATLQNLRADLLCWGCTEPVTHPRPAPADRGYEARRQIRTFACTPVLSKPLDNRVVPS